MSERDEQQSIKELEAQVIDLLNRLNASPEHVWTSDGYMTKDDYIAKLEKRILELATENTELENRFGLFVSAVEKHNREVNERLDAIYNYLLKKQVRND